MKKKIISVASILLVSIMMAVMLSGCFSYNRIGYYSYSVKKPDQGLAKVTIYQDSEDSNKYMVDIAASFAYKESSGIPVYDDYRGEKEYTGAKKSCSVSINGNLGQKAETATITSTNGNLGDAGSKATLKIGKYTWSAVVITK